MDEHSGLSRSLWMDTTNVPTFPALAANDTSDVCIIGAGISGLTTAYLLLQNNISVIVLDDGPPVSGESERTSAHLSNALDDRYFMLEKHHGEHGAQAAAQSHSAAIDKIEAISTAEGIDCDFERVDGYLFLPPSGSIETLQQELDAIHRAGLLDTELCDAPLASLSTLPVLRFPRQAQFNPLKYLTGLITIIGKLGGRIYSNTHASTVVPDKPARVITSSGHTITSESVVVATNTPINDWVTIHTKQASYRTYVVCATIPMQSVPRALYWDTEDPYHYVRVYRGIKKDNLIIGGEDHRVGQARDAEQRYARLEKWAREHFPMIEEVTHRWSGQIVEPADGLAFIGLNPSDDNVYIVTGDSGNGLTHGTIAAMIITDLIKGRENPWAALYNPSRLVFRASGTFIQENLNTAAQYADWITKGNSKEATFSTTNGAVVTRGRKKLAIYKDPSGHLHERSAICPHLKGLVNWNQAEESWDCPCHGLRFDRYGTVINGPANRNLSKP